MSGASGEAAAPIARQELLLRLAAALSRDFDAGRAATGLAAWEAADILPLGALVERLYEDALYSGLASRLPLALTSAQERAVWRS